MKWQLILVILSLGSFFLILAAALIISVSHTVMAHLAATGTLIVNGYWDGRKKYLDWVTNESDKQKNKDQLTRLN